MPRPQARPPPIPVFRAAVACSGFTISTTPENSERSSQNSPFGLETGSRTTATVAVTTENPCAAPRRSSQCRRRVASVRRYERLTPVALSFWPMRACRLNSQRIPARVGTAQYPSRVERHHLEGVVAVGGDYRGAVIGVARVESDEGAEAARQVARVSAVRSRSVARMAAACRTASVACCLKTTASRSRVRAAHVSNAATASAKPGGA